MRSLLVRAAIAAALLAPAACGGGGSDSNGPVNPPPVTNPPPGTTPPPSTSTVDTVRITGGSFDPATLTVRAGRTVVWVSETSVLHTVTPDGHSQWTRRTTSAPGEVLRVTFGSAGAFPYYCEPHRSSGMTGQVTVQQ